MIAEQLHSIEQKLRLLAQRMAELERENEALKEQNRLLRAQLDEKNTEVARPKISNRSNLKRRSHNISAVDFVMNGFHLPNERDDAESVEKIF